MACCYSVSEDGNGRRESPRRGVCISDLEAILKDLIELGAEVRLPVKRRQQGKLELVLVTAESVHELVNGSGRRQLALNPQTLERIAQGAPRPEDAQPSA